MVKASERAEGEMWTEIKEKSTENEAEGRKAVVVHTSCEGCKRPTDPEGGRKGEAVNDEFILVSRKQTSSACFVSI